jgi:hypothetical protein
MMGLTKWTPTTDLMTLRRAGKFVEEGGEALAVVARLIIQGIDEIDPGSGKVNRQRLMEELADLRAQIECSVLAFELDQEYMSRRTAEKMRLMAEWEAMLPPAGSSATEPVFVVDHVGSSYGEGPKNTTVIVGHSAKLRALAKGAKLYEQA